MAENKSYIISVDTNSERGRQILRIQTSVAGALSRRGIPISIVDTQLEPECIPGTMYSRSPLQRTITGSEYAINTFNTFVNKRRERLAAKQKK